MPGYFENSYGQYKPSTVSEDEFANTLASMNANNKNSYLNGNQMAAGLDSGYNKEGLAAGTAGGAAAGSVAGPVGAGIGAVGGFMTALMAQKAQDERQRRANAVGIEQTHAQNQSQGYDTMMRGFQGALR